MAICYREQGVGGQLQDFENEVKSSTILTNFFKHSNVRLIESSLNNCTTSGSTSCI